MKNVIRKTALQILLSIISSILFFLICSFAAQASEQARPETFSRIDAFELLQKNGYKWQLTDTLKLEAEAKTELAQSEMAFKAELVARQFALRTNPITFGLNESLHTGETMGFGTTALVFNLTLLDFANQAKILGAKENEKMSSAQSLQYKNDLTALMLIQYLNIQRLKKQLEAMDANLNRSRLIQKFATAKKSVGSGIPLDIARAKNLVELDQLKKLSTFTKLIKAKHDLALLLGLDRIQGEVEPLVPKPIHEVQFQTVVAKTLDTRPDLKAANLALSTAQFARDESRRSLWPKIALVGEAGSTNTSLLGLPVKNLTGAIGVSVTLPLETGGYLQGKRKEAEVMSLRADLQLKQTKAEIVSQIKEALEQLIAAEEALKASNNYLKTAEEESQISEKRFYSGSSNSLDMTTSHTNLAQAIDTNTESIFNYEAAKVNYYRTLGDFSEYFQLEKGETHGSL